MNTFRFVRQLIKSMPDNIRYAITAKIYPKTKGMKLYRRELVCFDTVKQYNDTRTATKEIARIPFDFIGKTAYKS